MTQLINKQALINSLKEKHTLPFDHFIINNFFPEETATSLVKEFPIYNDEKWYVYNNELEHKKTNNKWNDFPATTYKVFSYLNSKDFIEIIEKSLNIKLFSDPGLHGGGWHIHGQGGNLNPHLDYSTHPKMGLQRKLNLIVYLSPELKAEHGGHLGLYSNESSTFPGKLIKEIEPRFNTAILFDTTQNSWHGMSQKLQLPDNIYRRSIAIYYLQEFNGEHDTRSRAFFAPRADQIGDLKVLETIRLRSDAEKYYQAYRK